MASSEEVGKDVPAGQRGSWSQFIKQIIASTGDLSSLTAPSFILSPISLTEFPAYWGEPTEEFIAISKGQTPEARIVLALKYVLSTLKGKYTSREAQTGSEKKPLNPILGELHYGEWATSTGPLKLTVEQVSHHPPVTAYHMESEQAGIKLQGHSGQKTSFSGKSIFVKQNGFAMISVNVPGQAQPEKYLITLPKLRIDGILLGSPYIELCEESHIQSSSGWCAHVTFTGAGWVTGKAHTFKANVAPTFDQLRSPAYVIDGQWTGQSKVTKARGKVLPEGSMFLDVPRASQAWTPAKVKDISEMGPMESRRVWKDVASGIRTGNFDQASAAKSKLENEQRQKRKDEQASGEPWALQLFTKIAQDQDYNLLARKCGFSPDTSEAYTLNQTAPVEAAGESAPGAS